MTEPIIISGTTDSGKRFVQFWTEHQKFAGTHVRYCWAEINRGEDTSLRVDGFCPEWLLTTVWDAYLTVRAGGTIAPTHTASWGRGDATFTPIEVGRMTNDTTYRKVA